LTDGEPTAEVTPAPESKSPPERASRGTALSHTFQTGLIPVLAVFTGLVIGAIVVIISDVEVINAYGNFFTAPGAALSATWNSIATAYGALFQGSVGNPREFIEAIRIYQVSGDTEPLRHAFWPITEALVASTPFIFAGLSVAWAFRGGLFNIGAEGQLFIGALCSAWVGYTFTNLPWFIHLPLALLAGALGGAVWGAIPGYLKAATGAHEVVNTIMMNWIAFRLSDWLLNGPMKAPGFRPVTPQVEDTAILPRLFGTPLRFNWGFFLALVVAGVVFWLLFKTIVGFETRSVGANPDAARYAGISIKRSMVLTMALAGALAGLGGASQVLGVDYWVGQGFSAGFGFDAIALALLGKSHPVGVVLAALLFGTLRSGATRMQSLAGIPIDIISIIQGLVIIFVAAPIIIRWLYRIHKEQPGVEYTRALTRGWGS
jgi:simple sugar transport system permease protein